VFAIALNADSRRELDNKEKIMVDKQTENGASSVQSPTLPPSTPAAPTTPGQPTT
jgi:hypothetical protein